MVEERREIISDEYVIVDQQTLQGQDQNGLLMGVVCQQRQSVSESVQGLTTENSPSPSLAGSQGNNKGRTGFRTNCKGF